MSGGRRRLCKKIPLFKCSDPELSGSDGICTALCGAGRKMAAECSDPVRRNELEVIALNCSRVPAKGAGSFYEACQSFWFVQQLIQLESSGHSISPGRFDQYMYPYYKRIWKTEISPESLRRS